MGLLFAGVPIAWFQLWIQVLLVPWASHERCCMVPVPTSHPSPVTPAGDGTPLFSPVFLNKEGNAGCFSMLFALCLLGAVCQEGLSTSFSGESTEWRAKGHRGCCC